MLDQRGVMNVVRKNLHPESRLVTDKAQHSSHRSPATKALTTASSRGDVHTNNMEGFFSILKRGVVGVCRAAGRKTDNNAYRSGGRGHDNDRRRHPCAQ